MLVDRVCRGFASKGQEVWRARGEKVTEIYRIYLTGKIARGVEHFYAAIERQAIENERVKVGFWDAVVKAVGEANRGSL
jgi:hypothetical protein